VDGCGTKRRIVVVIGFGAVIRRLAECVAQNVDGLALEAESVQTAEALVNRGPASYERRDLRRGRLADARRHRTSRHGHDARPRACLSDHPIVVRLWMLGGI
jgi:hypothetical protein